MVARRANWKGILAESGGREKTRLGSSPNSGNKNIIWFESSREMTNNESKVEYMSIIVK